MILDARLKLGWIEEKSSEENNPKSESEVIDDDDKKIDISEKILNARILK